MSEEGKRAFVSALEALKGSLLADGRIDLCEAAILLRLVRPFVANGVTVAVELDRLLREVCEDGVVTQEESDRLVGFIELLTDADVLSLGQYVSTVPDFPKPGVIFRDITGILDTAEGFKLAVDLIVKALNGVKFDVVVAMESRGFIFGAAVADRLGKAFVPVRKPGKLPPPTIHVDYTLEYGTATLHMRADAVLPGERIVVIDDLLATGGTAAAAAKLVEKLGGTVVKMVFPIELEGFEARRNALAGYDVVSLVQYPGK